MFNQRAYRCGAGYVRFYPAGVFGHGGRTGLPENDPDIGVRLPDDEAEAIWNKMPRGRGNDEAAQDAMWGQDPYCPVSDHTFDQGGLKRTPEGLLESVHIPTAEEAREEKMPYMATGTGGPPPKKPPVLEWRVEPDGWVTLLVDGTRRGYTKAQHHVCFRNWRTVGVKRAKKHLLDVWERQQADIAWAERESGCVER